MKKKLANYSLIILSAVTMFMLTVGVPTYAVTNTFTDVVKGAYYYDAVIELSNKGIVEGAQVTSFGVEREATRAEAAYFIANALNLDTKNVKDPGFTDVAKTSKYYGAIAALANLKVINGYGNGKFGPNDTLERYAIAKMLTIAFELNTSTNLNLPFKDLTSTTLTPEIKGYIQTLVDYDITIGTSATTFSPHAKVKKVDLTLFLKRAIDVQDDFVIISVQ